MACFKKAICYNGSMSLIIQLPDINIGKINDFETKSLIIKLLNIIENQHQENQLLKKTIQEFKDEVNRLKGEQGKPNIRPNTKPTQQGDISSETERKDIESNQEGKNERKKKKKKKKNHKPSRIHRCRLDKNTLPADAVFKGYERNIIPEIYFHIDYVEFKRDKYYSPSEKKTYIAPLPPGYTREFSPSVQSWVIGMKHDLNSTESIMTQFLNNRGLEISCATISRMLTKDIDVLHQEHHSIFLSGLRSLTYLQTDDTMARVNGKNYHTHIFCNNQFSSFFTKPNKDRLTLLDILRVGKAREYIINSETIKMLRFWNLPEKRILMLTHLQSDRIYSQAEFDPILRKIFTDPKKQLLSYQKLIMEAAYIARYHQEDCLTALVCDHAPQFKFLALFLSLCWIHEGRHYKKMCPIVPLHRKQLEEFRKQFWQFYKKLLDFKDAPSKKKAEAIGADFDALCSFETTYSELKERIAKTQANKAELLYVLIDPAVPLHNNESELGARKKVRDRDIRLHTMSDEGTRANDMFLSLRETARKQGVGFMEYIFDRLSGAYTMTSLADLIPQNRPSFSTT
jgi:hypothetical protein